MRTTIWNGQWRGKQQEEQLRVRSDQRGLLFDRLVPPDRLVCMLMHNSSYLQRLTFSLMCLHPNGSAWACTHIVFMNKFPRTITFNILNSVWQFAE